MSLIKWTPLLSDSEFDDFDKMFSEFSPVLWKNKSSFVPAVDIYEEKDSIVIEAPLAGINPDKVDISIDNNVLCIRGEGKKESEVEDKNYYRKEIRRGSFYRNIPLPDRVDGEKAEASIDDGVLKITIPKISESKLKKIKIKTNDK